MQNLVHPFEPFKTSPGRSLSPHSLASYSLFSCCSQTCCISPWAVVQWGWRHNLVHPFEPFKTSPRRSLSPHSLASYSLFSRTRTSIHSSGQFPTMQCEDPFWERFSSPFQPCNSHVHSRHGRGAIHHSILHTDAFENLFCVLRANEASDWHKSWTVLKPSLSSTTLVSSPFSAQDWLQVSWSHWSH